MKETDLISFRVVEEETDLFICASTNLKRKALKLVSKYRKVLKSYIEKHPSFFTAERPLSADNGIPNIIKAMLDASEKTNVGPMASVAGAIAEFVGNELAEFSPEVIVENGGDLYLKGLRDRKIGVYAGNSP